jgi:hypothetical protein
MNIHLNFWENEDKHIEKEESFKQSLMQAFPSMAKELYTEDENAISEEYEQILPKNMEEFQSIEDLLNEIHTVNAEQIEN